MGNIDPCDPDGKKQVLKIMDRWNLRICRNVFYERLKVCLSLETGLGVRMCFGGTGWSGLFWAGVGLVFIWVWVAAPGRCVDVGHVFLGMDVLGLLFCEGALL